MKDGLVVAIILACFGFVGIGILCGYCAAITKPNYQKITEIPGEGNFVEFNDQYWRLIPVDDKENTK